MDLTAALLAYAVPAALITMLPGPDTAMVLTTGIRSGRAAAVRAAFGVGTGLLLWGAAAAVGLAAALRSSAVLYDAFRLTCAAYLLVLAAQAFRSARRTARDGVRDGVGDGVGDGVAAPAEAGPLSRSTRLPSLGWGYRRALLTCALNPKLGVFFVVFLPQFIPAGANVAQTSLALATLQAGEAVLWYLLLGQLAAGAGQLLSRQRVRVWLDRFTATLFLGFGLRLATDARH